MLWKKLILLYCFLYQWFFVGIGLIAYAYLPDLFSSNSSMIQPAVAETTAEGLQYIGAGLSSIGLLGAGIGQGYAAGKGAEGVSRNPEAEGKIRNMMIVGAAIAETSALYAFVIGILLVFVA